MSSWAKGFQLVLLSNWHPDSATKFLNTVAPYGPGIEFTFAPYIKTAAQGRYKNAKTIMDGLVKQQRGMTICVYLSFQATEGTKDATIEANATDFNKNFLIGALKNPGVTIVVCPSLEDNVSNTTFARWSTKIATKLDPSLVGRVVLRRSPLPKNTFRALPPRGSFNGTQLELHGASATSDHYSNDGNLVYSKDRTESVESLEGDDPKPQYELATFRTGAEGKGNTVTLLWRPLYNVYFKDRNHKDSKGKTITYFYGRNVNGVDRRRFDNTVAGFDDDEVKVARTFLGI